MAQPGVPDIRTIFQEGKSSTGLVVKKPWYTSTKAHPAAGTTSRSLAKGKGQSSKALDAQEKRGLPSPPPRFPSASARDQAAPTDPTSSIVPATTVRIPVNAQDFEKNPDTFRGTLYETVNHMVEHIYKANLKDLRVIEERSPEIVLESALGMNLTVSQLSLAEHTLF